MCPSRSGDGIRRPSCRRCATPYAARSPTWRCARAPMSTRPGYRCHPPPGPGRPPARPRPHPSVSTPALPPLPAPFRQHTHTAKDTPGAAHQVVLPSAARLTAAEIARIGSRDGQAVGVNTVELELTADWDLTVRVLGELLGQRELQELCFRAGDGLQCVNALQWPSGPDGAPRLLLEAAAHEDHGPASAVIAVLEHLLSDDVAVCQAIPVDGHDKREALLADRGRFGSSAGLLLGAAKKGGALVTAAEEELPEFLARACVPAERRRVIRYAGCARLVHANTPGGFASRQCAACGHYAASALRHVADRVLPLEERKQQHAAWTKPGSRRCAHPSPPAPS